MELGYIATRRGQMHYRAAGQGEPLILVHQTLRSSDVFSAAMPQFGAKYRVIAIDLPGFGQSDPLPGEVTVSDHADNIMEFADALGLDTFRIGGIHTGGAIGAEAAIARPDRVRALVLIGYPYIRNESDRDAMRTQLGRTLPQGGLLVPEATADGAHLTSLWHWASTRYWWGRDSVMGDDLSEEDLAFLESYVVDAIRARASMAQTHRALLNYDSDSRLPLVRVPTLIVAETSRYQREILQRAEMVAKLIKGSRVVSIPGTDINLLYFKRKDVTEAIMDFLADAGQAPS